MKESPKLNKKEIILRATKRVISKYHLYNYLNDYPWLTGFIGNLNSPVWFIAENPSLNGVKKAHKDSNIHSENLQWNYDSGNKLLRQSLTEYSFKEGDPSKNVGWNCYITNVIKEPDIVSDRKEKKKNKKYIQEQAIRWLPVLQLQIDNGKPKVLVAMGKQSLGILNFMKRNGLKAPLLDLVPHYSYIMKYYDNKMKLGPGDPKRVEDYRNSILQIKNKYQSKNMS